MRRHVAVTLFVAALAASAPARADAWGFEAHKYIMGRAIALLPQQIRPFFEASRVALVEHVVDPDLWRTAGWDEEGTQHFIDMDAYGPHPFTALPHDLDEAIGKHGKAFVEQNGTLPWRTEEFYRKLVDAFRQTQPYSRENIKFFSSVVGHYAADAHVPFHAALNHDGQLTEQWGIHARFESDLFERNRARLRIVPRPLTPVASVRELIFTALTESFPFVRPVLEADKAAVAGRDVYDDGYYVSFFGKVRPILEQRVSDSITAVASIIAAAWVEAGRPALPLQARRPPRKVRRQQPGLSAG
ncbi:MAG TPA: hypothetical protein VJ813_03865 [Vicinamibacterales bacterium]|nr:hypothetical protein [Vicinamibacterales bacterium]